MEPLRVVISMCDNFMITGPVSVSCLRMRFIEKARNLYAIRTVRVKLRSHESLLIMDIG